MQEIHLLKMLFGTNLISNSSTNASKKAQYSMPNYHFLVQMRQRFNAYFSWSLFSVYTRIVYFIDIFMAKNCNYFTVNNIAFSNIENTKTIKISSSLQFQNIDSCKMVHMVLHPHGIAPTFLNFICGRWFRFLFLIYPPRE